MQGILIDMPESGIDSKQGSLDESRWVEEREIGVCEYLSVSRRDRYE